MTKRGMKVVVAGRVLGVSFRSHAHRTASRLGLTGYVLSNADGTLEVLAEGDSEQLETFAVWLQDGPKRAEIDDYSMEWLPYGGTHGRFTIRYARD